MVDQTQDTVTKQEFNELRDIVKELAEAQKRTEQRFKELADAQQRTDQRFEELAIAQRQADQRMEKLAQALELLIKDHQETRRQLGGLSMTVGYALENIAYKGLPELLKRDFGLIVKDRLKRQYVLDKEGEYIEVNIVGEATQNGKTVVIVGEGKAQLSRNDVDRFIRKKLNRLEGVYDEIFPVLVTHMTSSQPVEAYVKGKGIALYYSYDLPLMGNF